MLFGVRSSYLELDVVIGSVRRLPPCLVSVLSSAVEKLLR